jgi:hypothetical protein
MEKLQPIVCWLFHQRTREILLPGRLPYGLDAVVFCWKCDEARGRPIRVFDPTQPVAQAS